MSRLRVLKSFDDIGAFILMRVEPRFRELLYGGKLFERICRKHGLGLGKKRRMRRCVWRWRKRVGSPIQP
jgi:hypothetical protein